MNEPAPAAGKFRVTHLLVALLALAAVGIGTFGALAWRAVRLERAEPGLAQSRFEAARARFTGTRARLARDASGRWLRAEPREPATRPAETLIVLAYHAEQRQLARAAVPLWFLELKGPAVAFSLRETRFDPAGLGLKAEDLAREGPGLLIDESPANGDRLLVWTE